MIGALLAAASCAFSLYNTARLGVNGAIALNNEAKKYAKKPTNNNQQKLDEDEYYYDKESYCIMYKRKN